MAKLKAVPTPTISTVISGLPLPYVQCRAWQHPWQPYTAEYVTIKLNGRSRSVSAIKQVLHCPRCDTYRVTHLARNGHPLRRSYDYAEGYLIDTKTVGHLTQEDRDRMQLLAVGPLLDQAPAATG